MKNITKFDVEFNVQKNKTGWLVRCPREREYGFIKAERCHSCFIDAMALNNKEHRGHNCKEGLFYREQRANGYLL